MDVQIPYGTASALFAAIDVLLFTSFLERLHANQSTGVVGILLVPVTYIAVQSGLKAITSTIAAAAAKLVPPTTASADE